MSRTQDTLKSREQTDHESLAHRHASAAVSDDCDQPMNPAVCSLCSATCEEWPLTMEAMANKLTISERTLNSWLRRLRLHFPDEHFSFGSSHAQRFEKRHYDLIVEKTACLLSSNNIRTGRTIISVAQSKRTGSESAYSKLREFALARPEQEPRPRSSGSAGRRSLLEELTSGKPSQDLTWNEVAVQYCQARALSRVSKRPELAGTTDPEAGYVLRLTDILITRKAANRPIRALKIEDVQAYFNEHLRDKKLSYLHRCRNSYLAVMNWAVEEEYCDAKYPMPELPEYDPRSLRVNKNLPLPVIKLFIEFAPKHAKLLFDTIFDTGLRGGELLFVKRTEPDDEDPRRSGLCLEDGNEHIHLGITKDGKAITRSISKRLAKRMRNELKKRKDAHDALFLTDKGVPYARANVQRGFQYRAAWKSTRKKVVNELTRQLDLAKEGRDAATARELRSWIKIAKRATGHWGRHSMISSAVLQGMSDRQIMAVSGHRSPQMIARYAHLRDNDSKELAEMVSLQGRSPAPSRSMTVSGKPAHRKRVAK